MNQGDALTTDDAIMEKVNDALRANATTAKAPIDVAAQGAEITLSGTVASEDIKRAAEQAARGVPGVIDVTNELVIGHDSGGLFGFGSDRGVDTDPDGTAGDVAVPGAVFAAGGGGANTGSGGGGYGAPAAALFGLAEERGNEPSGETNASRNADTEEEDMSQ